ncbi:MAG: phosphoglycolate phosphatase [Halioglobus sp.]|nr:phosphoglycolate phosphatase [Halioglobus sp.]|tara:strand:- start:1482 stop:2168 length:687 start_codon:yes stop_codon:yes gene_type:complete
MNNAGTAFPQTLRAVIFDLDGTLVDTADEFVPAVQALRAEHGLAPMAPARIRASVSNGARALVSLGLGMQETHADFEGRRQRLLQLYSEVLGSAARLYPGIDALLRRLQAAGVAWGISTNKPRPYTEPLLQSLAIDPAPGSVVCPEDVAERKPHPETLYRNCRDLGCAPFEAVYIGDHLRDIEAGRRAGMYTIAAAYGYIEDGDDPDRWGACARADNSEHLASLIFRE